MKNRLIRVKDLAEIMDISYRMLRLYVDNYTLVGYTFKQRYVVGQRKPTLYFKVTDESVKALCKFLIIKNKYDAYNNLIDWRNETKNIHRCI